LIVSADSLPQVLKGKFALAAFSTNAELAQAAAAECAPALRVRLEKLSAPH